MTKVVMPVKTLVVTATLIAMALVLHMIKLPSMPQGGAITAFSMLFVALPGWLFGAAVGGMGGVAFGLIQMILDGYAFHPGSFLFDYALAFGALGAAAGASRNMYVGYAIGVLARFACSFLSGALFFASYASGSFLDGTFSGAGLAVVYSLWYNASYMAPEAAATVLVLALPPVRRALDAARKRLGAR